MPIRRPGIAEQAGGREERTSASAASSAPCRRHRRRAARVRTSRDARRSFAALKRGAVIMHATPVPFLLHLGACGGSGTNRPVRTGNRFGARRASSASAPREAKMPVTWARIQYLKTGASSVARIDPAGTCRSGPLLPASSARDRTLPNCARKVIPAVQLPVPIGLAENRGIGLFSGRSCAILAARPCFVPDDAGQCPTTPLPALPWKSS